jgi:hypothetical protein
LTQTAGVDLNQLEHRMQIRAAIQAGNIDEAVQKVNLISSQVKSKLYHYEEDFANESKT